jgi:hypothetical protein
VRSSTRIWGLLAALAVPALLAASCGASAPQAKPSPTPSPRGDLPPAWLQKEAAWQSLAAGDAQPERVDWVLTRADRAARLAGSQTGYLRFFKGTSPTEAYVVVVHGRFRRPGAPGVSDRTLYLVIRGAQRYVFAQGVASTPLHLKRLPAMHSYVPVLPVATGVWGHTMMAGGPAPGGPWSRRDIAVAVFAGRKASGTPLTTVRSDAAGFFTLALQPGVYTFAMTSRDHGFPEPVTVRVRAGAPVAAGVFGGAP